MADAYKAKQIKQIKYNKAFETYDNFPTKDNFKTKNSALQELSKASQIYNQTKKEFISEMERSFDQDIGELT